MAVLAAGLLTGCASTTDAADAKASGSTSSADGAKAAGKAHRPEDDVVVTKCSTDEFAKLPQAELMVTNHSSKASNYIIEVEFTDRAGTRKGEGTAALNNLAPARRRRRRRSVSPTLLPV
ncbi:hypothetical protein [Streptomyces sp. NPDC087437]|uniref:hypothetical protein n=1 Tax=Streptomyces sp. NPDC087437 TaxID=3365789 RepID=UPI00382C7776